MKKIKSIRLYSLPEVTVNGEIVDPQIQGNIKPIKTAHFEYKYDLCEGIPNNSKNAYNDTSLNTAEISNNGGKLTLHKVYFTYRNSNMGKYTPYIFEYSTINPVYNMKGFDIWGNYKENPIEATGEVNSNIPTTTEYPYVNQTDRDKANSNTSSWTLSKIKLPSGGEIKIETESDDYQFVQDKKAMEFYEVVGCGNSENPSQNNNPLYIGAIHKHTNYLYVKLKESSQNNMSSQEFINKYLSENYEKAIKFRFLLNMRKNNWQYEYVDGYFEIDRSKNIKVENGLVSIPLVMLRRDGGSNGNV
ncbi:MAG: hypothetical protein HC854_13425, partial [Flavobacterium sp.]|nr:hypothetical protein [Flavobacterium sp.]